MWGAQLKPDMAIRHVSEVAAGADLPIVVFEYPPASGIGYAPETLARFCEIPQVAAVKDWSNDIVAFERNLRAIRATGRPVAVLSSFTMSLMASFLLGADGAISGMGSVVADLQADLFDACRKGDLEEARRINDRLDPLVRVFYAPPFVDMHNRMKEALVILGRIPAAHVRPPLTPIPDAERHAIRAALARGQTSDSDFRHSERMSGIKVDPSAQKSKSDPMTRAVGCQAARGRASAAPATPVK